MRLLWCVAAAVASLLLAPTAHARTRSLAFLGVHAGNGYDAGKVETLEESFLTALAANGYFTKVTGRSDFAALLGFEQTRQLAGCTDTGCMAELAGALGVDDIASADVGVLGGVTVVHLKVIEVQSAEVVARAMGEVANEAELLDTVRRLARDIVPSLRERDVRRGRVDLDARPPLALAFVPFGAGQFANHMPVKGSLFLVGELAAFSTFAFSLHAFEADKLPGSGGVFGGGTFRDPSSAQRLENVYLASFWTGVALVAVGVVDALVERP